MPGLSPPFRADHVGSLLRPPELASARAQMDGRISPIALRGIEDEAIKKVVALQEKIGLKAVTDGEFRRGSSHIDFLEQIEGIEAYFDKGVAQFSNAKGQTFEMTPPRLRTVGRLAREQPIMRRDYEYLAALVTKGTPKIAIPSPSMAHFRGGRSAVNEEAYPDIAEFYADLARVYREEVADLADAGCRYLQLDDTSLADLCDEAMRAESEARGEDPDRLPEACARLINDSIASARADMTIAIHLRRGDSRDALAAEGGYDAVAEVLFNQIEADAFFLDYDGERPGDVSPLRFVPRGKFVVLGMINTRAPELESKDEIKRRIYAAARIVPIEQLCLSPQCGFSSTQHGNDLTFDDQRRKLDLVVEVAGEIWRDS